MEETLHPVFIPHPRLSVNIEQIEDVGNTDHTSSIARGFPEDAGYDLKVDVDSKNVIGLWEDVDSISNKKSDKNPDDGTEFHGANVDVDHLDLRAPKQDIMEKRVTLMDQEDHSEWYKKVQTVEINRVEEDERLDQEDDAHWDKDSEKSEDSEVEDDKECYSEGAIKWNGHEEGTTEDSYAHKTSNVPDDELSTDIAAEDFTENETMSSEMSEAFNTANVCALLETVESDKKQGVEETFRLHGDSNAREVFKSVDVMIADDVSVSSSGALNGKDSQVYDDDLGEQFDSGKPSCSNIENDQELKKDVTFEECDKHVSTNSEDSDSDVNSDKELDNVSEHVLNSSNVEDNVAERVSEHGGSSGGAHRQVEEIQQEVHERMSIDPSVDSPTWSENEGNIKENYDSNEARFYEVNINGNSHEDKAMEGDNGEQFGKDLTLDEGFVSKVDDSIEAAGHSEFRVVEDTRVKLGEEAELSYKNQEIVEKPAMTPHGHTERKSDDCITGETLKDSLDQTASCSHEDDTIVDFTGDLKEIITGEDNNVDQSLASVENKNYAMANVENNNESCDGLQHDDTEVPHSNTIEMDNTVKESVESDEESAFGDLEKESVAESASETEMKKISPRLRERASSLLSALKDEITGGNSKDIQSGQSSIYLPSAARTSGVDDTKDTEPDTTSDISASDTQEITNAEK